MPTANASPSVRPHVDELIADLFEAMHDLHFLRDAAEGGNFCLQLAMSKLPSAIGIVHLYDIDRREFLVTSTRGGGADQLLLRRHPENETLLSAAMAKRRAIVLVDASSEPAALAERYRLVGGARSMMVAPVMQAGRFLGAIELLNPLDGQPFTEEEGNALTYIAQQFAEYVATRGIVTDPERIQEAARSRAG
jgi:GAF domain-containing protein